MSMIVARMQKMKAENLIGIGNHNQRKTKNHSNPDIDTSLSELNYDLVNRTENYKTDIENFINENKSTTWILPQPRPTSANFRPSPASNRPSSVSTDPLPLV